MFPTFYVLLVFVVLPSDHIRRWDANTLKDRAETKTFLMPSEASCEDTAATFMAVSSRGVYPEGTVLITRCHSVAAYSSES
jgi:hypothetical protein